MIIKVQAVALAPGDVRVMKGHCDFFQSPGAFPYIPGGDLSGIVEESYPTSRFKKGKKVIAMFEVPRPLGALAEYASVKENLVEIAPTTASAAEAACLTSSALAAFFAVKRYVRDGSRVLILGGSGGVGTFLVQLAKLSCASYIVATTTDEKLVKSLGADHVIDYTTGQKWWEIDDFKSDPFDMVFDLVVGKREGWEMAKSSKVLKSDWKGGKYCSFNGDEPLMEIHTAWQAAMFMLRITWRTLWTTLWVYAPKYIWHNGLDVKPGSLAEIVTLFNEGKLKAVIDPSLPSEFLPEAVKIGFHVMEKRNVHGKVVIEVGID